jgi:hypothetical protein
LSVGAAGGTDGSALEAELAESCRLIDQARERGKVAAVAQPGGARRALVRPWPGWPRWSRAARRCRRTSSGDRCAARRLAALAALAANTNAWWTALIIDLNNALIRLYSPASLTGLFESDNLLGWLTMQALAAPLFLLFAIVTIVAFCALVLQLWGRP